jgi:hypothetical protein
MIYGGIDPGEDGAISIIEKHKKNPFPFPKKPALEQHFIEEKRIEIYDCPKTLQERRDLLESIAGYGFKNIVFAIEKASKTIRIGIKTYHATVLWGNYQAWLMALTCLDIRHEIVPARRWQTILDGNKKLSTKERAWEAACRLYPEAIPLLKGKRGSKKFGFSDALMIGEWGRRNL